MSEETKKCSKCGEVKPLSEFHKFKHSKDGLKPRCKPCNIFDANKYASEHKEECTRKKMNWYRQKPEDYRKKRERASNARRGDLLPDSYIATLVARQDFSASEVPVWLINLKREQIELHRLSKRIKQTIKEVFK